MDTSSSCCMALSFFLGHQPGDSLSLFSCLSLPLRSSFLPVGTPSPSCCYTFRTTGLRAELTFFTATEAERVPPASAPLFCFLSLHTTSPAPLHHPAVINQNGLLERFIAINDPSFWNSFSTFHSSLQTPVYKPIVHTKALGPKTSFFLQGSRIDPLLKNRLHWL